MHFEVLVEDASGEQALRSLLPRILGEKDTFKVHSYKGIGRLPTNLKANTDANKRILLDQLPRLIRGYGRTFQGEFEAVLVIICDLDNRCLREFRAEMLELLANCDPAPPTQFCIAVEEGEAWLLGDTQAVLAAFPNAKRNALSEYTNDEICGTWEKLADSLYRGGSTQLRAEGWRRIGLEKSNWAAAIAPIMNVEENSSPSFCYMRDKLRSYSRRSV